MAYTTEAAVEDLLADDYDSAVAFTLAQAIEVANELVEEICAPVASYSASRLEKIERYLAAHFWQISKPRVQTEGFGQGDLENTIQSKIDLGLFLTHYGQKAAFLDTAGGLARLQQKTVTKNSNVNTQTPTLEWLGTKRDVQGNVVSTE